MREVCFTLQLAADAANGRMIFIVGVVKTGLDHETKHFDTNNAWYLYVYDGSLCGNGKFGDDAQDQLKAGDRVGVLVDLDGGEGGDGGSVRFFVNGSKYGPGFKSGVKGPVVLGVELIYKSQKVTLLPEAEKPAGV